MQRIIIAVAFVLASSGVLALASGFRPPGAVGADHRVSHNVLPAEASAAGVAPAVNVARSSGVAWATSGSALELEDLPGGWQVTRDRVNDARQLADDAAELEELARQGFIQNRQRDFENLYGGGARHLYTSVSRFRDAAGASARVAFSAAYTRQRASAIRVDEIASMGIQGDEPVVLRLDRGSGELAYVAYFRVGAWSVGMMAVGYSDAITEFLLDATRRQTHKLLSVPSEE